MTRSRSIGLGVAEGDDGPTRKSKRFRSKEERRASRQSWAVRHSKDPVVSQNNEHLKQERGDSATVIGIKPE